MTDKVEAQGKTVKEAVSEGLLQMGARENEVKVTVLEQPKAGLFGFLGGKQAKVLIEKKAPRARSGRRPSQRDDHAGHGFGAAPDSSSRRGKNTRRNSGGQNQDSQEKRASSPRQEKNENTREGTSSRRRGGRSRGGSQSSGSQQVSPQGTRESASRQDQAPSRSPKQENRELRSRRSAPQAKRSTSSDNRGGRNMNRNRYQHNDADMILDKNNPHLDEQRKHFEAAENLRRNEEKAKNADANRNARPSQKQTDDGNDQRGSRRSDSRNKDASDNRDRSRNNRGNGGRSRNQDRNARPDSRPAPAPRQEPQVPDELIIQGLSALKFSEALEAVPLEEANTTLESVTNELFRRAGFPCTCEVKDDEYSLVKIVTDDASAGMLIGRHGSTVDAIEHLVERMTCNAVGERVRMNLDINNYRHRREESLVERVAEAVKTVLSSGRPYHIEPQDARERRMVHMEALKTEGLRTYTMYGAGGKHVVIAIDDKPKDTAAVEAEGEAEVVGSGFSDETATTDEMKIESSDSLNFEDDTEENPAP